DMAENGQEETGGGPGTVPPRRACVEPESARRRTRGIHAMAQSCDTCALSPFPFCRSPALSTARSPLHQEEPAREDIRLLGRLLGDVIRECEGTAVYETIETLRRSAVRFRREGRDSDARLLEARVKRLARDDANSVARAFSYFLPLANIAEDHEQNKQQRAHALADGTPQRGSLRNAVAVLR